MSSQRVHKKKCIIKKLDFENTIVTNIRTKAKGRKKLRARIIREIKDPSDIPENSQPCEKPLEASPVLTQKKKSRGRDQTSPVLIKRQLNERGSRAFLKKKKINFSGEEKEKSSEEPTVDELYCSPSSPVFKLQKKNKILNKSPSQSQEFENVLKKVASFDMLSEGDSNSCLQSSYQIEEITQESKDSFKISSVESTESNDCSPSIFSMYRVESNVAPRQNKFGDFTSDSFNIPKKCETPRLIKRNYKKNSLLGRLRKIQQKQASEKLLWQHQKRKNSTSSLRFSVITFWKDEFNFFLKCKSFSRDLPVTFLIVDCRWVPDLRKIKESSILQLHPPWQKLTVEESGATVLVNVICLDVLNETEDPIQEKKTFDPVPVKPFETQEHLFVDSLFFHRTSAFLY